MAIGISIHAPARGATRVSHVWDNYKRYFNPRSREGSDEVLRHVHAGVGVFQSTLPRGERPSTGPGIAAIAVLFQSTLPRGERRNKQNSKGLGRHFNPRSREGSDVNVNHDEAIRLCISIHAPARGATAESVDGEIDLEISIHAPARGATQPSVEQMETLKKFQSTLPRGERQQK